jgi:hypothetical protein
MFRRQPLRPLCNLRPAPRARVAARLPQVEGRRGGHRVVGPDRERTIRSGTARIGPIGLPRRGRTPLPGRMSRNSGRRSASGESGERIEPDGNGRPLTNRKPSTRLIPRAFGDRNGASCGVEGARAAGAAAWKDHPLRSRRSQRRGTWSVLST